MEEINKVEEEITNNNAVEERVRNLHKGKKEAEALAEAKAKEADEARAELAKVKKDTEFLNSFSDITTKFPTASEYKDKIKEKVMLGYSVDDATAAVLVAEGKYQAPRVESGMVAGGSAPNQIVQNVQKTPQQMSSTERWDALREAEKRGDISMS